MHLVLCVLNRDIFFSFLGKLRVNEIQIDLDSWHFYMPFISRTRTLLFILQLILNSIDLSSFTHIIVHYSDIKGLLDPSQSKSSPEPNLPINANGPYGLYLR